MPSTIPYASHSYVDEWLSTDRLARKTFGNGTATESAENLLVLQNFCRVYGIGRSFRKIDGEQHLASALRALLLTEHRGDVNETYVGLFLSLRKLYGLNLWSATSKLLWLRFGSPFRLYDQFADKWMKVNGAGSWGNDENEWYGKYCRLWQTQYDEHSSAIADACLKISKVREFFVINDEQSDSLAQALTQPWFHERVFDHYISWVESSSPA